MGISRRQFVQYSVAACAPMAGLAAGEPAAVFPYRVWSFCVNSSDWALLVACVNAAIPRARQYGIETFELHDYTIGRRGLVDASVTYRDFPKLAAKDVLHYGTESCTRTQRERDYERLRELARRIKAAGLRLNFCYHVLRDAPAELTSEYPQIRDLNSGFYFTYVEGLLREFFDRVPEVDRLTITSLHETPSILSQPGTPAREDRLLNLYRTIHQLCRRADKVLIIRDFIVRYEDFETFWNVIPKLPDDVYVMTKEVLADWIHMDMPPNPFLRRYAGRRTIVEFDLYGEYWGRLDIPACYPEYLQRQIRTIKAFDVHGATGRVVHDDQRSGVFETIFESPNEVNCFAFGQLLSRPLPWLGPGQFTDRREKPGRWGWDLDAFDRKIWMDWATTRYGRAAAVPVIRALSRTDDVLPLLLGIGGRAFQAHSVVPGLRSVSFLWEPFVERVESVGIDLLRDEKREAHTLVSQCTQVIESARNVLRPNDFEQLHALFTGELLIVRSYAAVLESYYQVYLAQKAENKDGLAEASGTLRRLAAEIATSRGEQFFRGLPGTLREMAEFAHAGKAPENLTSS